MRRKRLGSRVLGVAAFLGATMMIATPANAADWVCYTDAHSDGAKIVPGNKGDHQTRWVGRTQARNTWDDWVWRGEPKVCPRRGLECTYEWQESKTTSAAWSVGGSIELGNASSPSKKWYNGVVSANGNYGRSTSFTSNFTFSVKIGPGSEVYPVQVVVRRWKQGDFVGGWVRTLNWPGATNCSTGPRNAPAGVRYEWDPNIRFGNWTTNEKERDFGSFAINGRIS